MILANLTIYSVLFILLALSIVGYLFYQNYKIKKENYKKLEKIGKNNRKSTFKKALLFVSFIIILFSIFQPKGKEIETKIKAKGVDVMFVLDVSKSMNTADIKYGNYKTTRLELAKKAISDYVVKHSENRYGLVIFAGDAIASIPLTTDKDIFLTLLEGVDYKNLTKQGSNFSKAVQLAINRFNKKDRGKVLVFLSDGGDEGDYNGLGFKIPNDIKSIVVGIGSKNGGKIILGQDAFGDYKYQTYKGHYVITRLNEENLKKLANDLNGNYFYLDSVSQISQIDNYIGKLTKKAINSSSIKERQDLSRYFIMFAFCLFMIYFVWEILDYNKN